MKNFLIVGTQRTGSTALHRALNFHAQIACGGEWTLEVPSHRKLSVAEKGLRGDFSDLGERQRIRIERVFHDGTKWLGFKLLFRSSGRWIVHPRFAPAIWLDRLEGHIAWLARRRDIRVIHIVRRDPVEWLKSKFVSDRFQSWAGKEYPKSLVVDVPIGEAIRRLRAKAWIDARLRTLERTNPYLRIAYEEFLESDADVVRRMLDFLECDPGLLRNFDYRTHRKQSTKSAREYIANYESLLDALGRHSLLAE
jgi:hypothetical protein